MLRKKKEETKLRLDTSQNIAAEDKRQRNKLKKSNNKDASRENYFIIRERFYFHKL